MKIVAIAILCTENIHHTAVSETGRNMVQGVAVTPAVQKREGADCTKAVSPIHFGCQVLIAKIITVAMGSDFTECSGAYRSTNNKATDPECLHRLKCTNEQHRPINLSRHGTMRSESFTVSERKTHLPIIFCVKSDAAQKYIYKFHEAKKSTGECCLPSYKDVVLLILIHCLYADVDLRQF